MHAQDVHDLLIIPNDQKLYRLSATPVGHGQAGYQGQCASEVRFEDTGYRKATSIARKGSDGKGQRGPAFAVLPNKPDASASQVSCYLINAENFRAANAWTQTEWSSEPDGEDKGLTPAGVAPVGDLVELVIATGSGRVYLLSFRERGQLNSVLTELRQLNLEGEIYEQLRNGVVAGSVWVEQAKRVVPIVNVSSLAKEQSSR